jgi:hypothetical protein
MAGVGLGWYFIRTIKKSETLAIRVLGFVGMLSVVQFAEVYAIAVQDKGLQLGATAVPNISFLVGLILFVVFKMDTDTTNVVNRGIFGRLGRSRRESGLGGRRLAPAGRAVGRDRLR